MLNQRSISTSVSHRLVQNHSQDLVQGQGHKEQRQGQRKQKEDHIVIHHMQTLSVLPRLRFCAIVPLNFEYDAAKTVPAGHLAHIDFGLSQDFESVGCVENSHAKNNIVFHRNSRSCNGYFDWCIGFLNCTGTSVQ